MAKWGSERYKIALNCVKKSLNIFSVSRWITESAVAVVVCMYWMTHWIDHWLLKKIFENKIWKSKKSKKVRKLKSENQKNCKLKKIFEHFLSVQTDHRVSSLNSMHLLNDSLYWMNIEEEIRKWNLKSRKFEIGKSKKL